MEVVTVVATFVGILTGVATLVGLLSKKVKGRKARRLELALAADGPADSYPVRFRCREEEEFHPQSGSTKGWYSRSSTTPITRSPSRASDSRRARRLHRHGGPAGQALSEEGPVRRVGALRRGSGIRQEGRQDRESSRVSADLPVHQANSHRCPVSTRVGFTFHSDAR